MTIEAVSSSLVIIRPPEKLVLEVRATGRYSSTEWGRNGITAGQPLFPVSAQSFAHFGEVYVAETTTMGDLGVYEVVLDPAPDSGQRVPSRLRFDVISPGSLVAYSVFSCNSEFCIAVFQMLPIPAVELMW